MGYAFQFTEADMRALCEHYRLSDDDTDLACAIVGGRIDPADTDAGKDLIRQCYHRPDDTDLVLTALDHALGTHGIEPVPSDCSDDADPSDLYLNAGDLYARTVIAEYDGFGGCDLYLCDLGTFMEEKQNDEDQ